MKKITVVGVAVLMSLGLVGCANTDIYSGNVYEGNQAKETRSISYGTIVSSRPVKIQADNQGIIGTIGGGALGGIAGSTIGGGTGQMIATTVGAIAGAVIGSKVEEKATQVDALELVIRKDNGQEIVVVQKYDASLMAGARVRIVGGSRVNVSVIR
ncbi:glycine zipper 2TM domain-containing protein [Pasteurella canis]|uniref:Outer membrane lipoprotein pcp n=1 Tax=Pasteurella canis TaxID=753 RepID=A0A379EUG0_9PAST|nr:glycine zipper 2TM domain-containing protein [Pasteurella canis]UAX42785.1 glycine zipper 2TM domain-containing protein [Pasteurella canis]UAY78288.1 glycine zipper 2TM domain-containing protein [Pasteurella canis]UEA17368.1 glycine zipper 2TM domain-containing protein [Pasteurella canis]UEC23873.1 glycine zipper 2TM domain-containing protein [Pasteurella canis]SPY33182.1 protein Lpp [Pasteurella canis]